MNRTLGTDPTQCLSRSWWQETEAPPTNGNFPFHFSSVTSWISAVILIGSFGFLITMGMAVSKLERLQTPEKALAVMVGRTMDAQDGLERAPQWEQQLFSIMTGDISAERAQAVEWYGELIRHSKDSLARLQLAVLQAEIGRVSQAVLSAYEWKDQEEPLPSFAEFIRAAYGNEPPPDRQSFDQMQEDLAGWMSANWFSDHLAARLAQRAGNQQLLAQIQARSQARADRLHAYSRRLTLGEFAAMLAGTVLLVVIWRRGKLGINPIRLHEPGVPPPWPGYVGAAILLRGGAIGAIVMAACLVYLPQDNASLRALAIPLTNIPLLLFAYYALFRPAGMTFEEGFGLNLPWKDSGRLIAAVLVAVAVGLWGEWAIERVAEQLHLSSHWTEWFDEDLVWGTTQLTLVSLLEYILFAPVFEELVFRGLLFAILRRKFRFFPAAFISAMIFGLAHGYGLIGLISVCWSGVLWAWIYEKTGSLVPAILAHAINNLLVCLGIMALLRW